MITKLSQIKHIRSFLNFSAADIEFSKKKSIIYAPNGTGKTNLSRVFRNLSDGKNCDELISQEAINSNDISFVFTMDGSEITLSNAKNNQELLDSLNVFNSDYIEETIKTTNFSNNDVSGEVSIPLGSESNEILKLKESISKDKKDREKIYKDLRDTKIIAFQNGILEQKKYSKGDKNIWKELVLQNIIDDKFNFSDVNKPKEYENCESWFEKVSNLDENSKIIIPHSLKEIDHQVLNFKDIQSVLKLPKTFVGFDKETKNNIAYLTTNWIEEELIKKGVEKSKEKNKCLLCKRDLDEDVSALFKSYEDYFKNEESKFKEKLSSYSKSVEIMNSSIDQINNSLQTQVDTLSKTLGLKKQGWKNIETSLLVSKLKELSESIEQKIEHPHLDCSIEIGDDGEASFNKIISQINQNIKTNLNLIKKINNKIDDTSKQKTILRTQIGKKFLYDFYITNKTDFDLIESFNQSIADNTQKLKTEQDLLPSKSASKNIKNLCNTYLHKYLFLEKYKVEEDNGIISIKLNNIDISTKMKKISEGEKTMIALAYFFSSSIRKFNSIDKFLKTNFIIDDPVCSMSYNHFFGVCSLIKYFDETIVKKLWKDNVDKLKQNPIHKIILTHNTQLFNVLRENTFKEKAEYFLLTSKELKKVADKQLQSEFYSALSNIKKAVSSPEEPHVIGNDLRRFFETVRHFFGFNGAFNEETLANIFDGFKEKEHAIFYNVVNYYSHGNPEAHTDPMPINFKKFLEQFDELIQKSLFSDLWNKVEY